MGDISLYRVRPGDGVLRPHAGEPVGPQLAKPALCLLDQEIGRPYWPCCPKPVTTAAGAANLPHGRLTTYAGTNWQFGAFLFSG